MKKNNAFHWGLLYICNRLIIYALIKACLFDLDGVIVDTAKYHYLAWRKLANELGFDFTEKDNERLKGISRLSSLNILLEIGGIDIPYDEKLKLTERKNENYKTYILKMQSDEILPGAKEFITELKSWGVKIALGSVSKNAMTILDHLKLTPLFDAIIDGTLISEAKPNPEVFLRGAEALAVLPEECVVFEDAAAGIEAAINANMRCIGVGSAGILEKANLVIEGLHQMSYEKLLCMLDP